MKLGFLSNEMIDKLMFCFMFALLTVLTKGKLSNASVYPSVYGSETH